MSKQGVPRISWCFTDHCVHDDEKDIAIAPDQVRYLVAQQEVCPDTGKIHWQGYIQLEKPQRLTALQKLLPGAHWLPAKGSSEQNFIYCTKLDTRRPGHEPVIYGAPIIERSNKRASSGMATSVVKKIKSGATMSDLWKDDTVSHYVLLHSKQIDAMISLQAFSSPPPVAGLCMERLNYDSECRWISQIAYWLAENIYWKTRPIRTRQLWLYSETGGIGKTSLLESLMKKLKTFVFPYDGDWVEGYDDSYELVTMDEYGGQCTVLFLKSFLDGSSMKLRRRNGSPYFKKHNVPIIICSNRSASQIYHKKSEADIRTLTERLWEVFIPDLSFRDQSVEHLSNVLFEYKP